MTNLASIKCPYSLLEGLPRYESLVHMFRAAVDECPDRTAIIWEDRRISSREFGRAAEGLRRQLEQIGVHGERVIAFMPNTIEMDVALMAVMLPERRSHRSIRFSATTSSQRSSRLLLQRSSSAMQVLRAARRSSLVCTR